MLSQRPRFYNLLVRGKSLALVFLLLFLTGVFSYTRTHTPTPVYAATSANINFQARLQSASGAIVPDGNYHMEFKLYTSASGGSAVWTETRSTGNLVRTVNGYLTVNLGSVNAFPSGMNWDQEHWLTMNVGGSGGSPVYDGEMTPRLKLTATPYAFSAGQLRKTLGANTSVLDFLNPTANRTLNLPDQDGTLCVQGSPDCVDVATTGTTATTSSNSGLEIGIDGLRLLGGCSDNQSLKWDATAEEWKCTSGSGSSIGVRESDGSPSMSADVIEFGPSGASDSEFIVTNEGSGVSRIRLGNDVLLLTNYAATLDATYVNESQSPAAGDVSGSFTAGFSVNDVQNNAVDLGAETVGDYMANLGTVVGLTITGTNSGEGSTPGLSVTYGFGANTAVQGSTQLTCASGSGDLSGGGTVITLGSGGTCGAITISEAPVFDTSVTTPLITYGGALTIQTTATGGADDLIFKTAGTEVMRLLENGNIYLEKGTNDVTIAVNAPGAAATYTFDGASGTILTTANYVTNLDATYVNESQSPAAGDVSGSFTAGFSVNDVQNNAVDLGAETVGDYMANLGTVVGLTITGTNSGEGSTPGLSVTYGFGANTAVQGSTQLTCASGSGDLSGGGTVITLGSGGTCGAITISEAPVFDTSVTTPLITYGGALTIQTTATGGADDLIFKTAGTEVMRLLENGNIYLEKGTNDVTIAVNAPGAAATYTFDGASGTILTTANYVTNLDATYVNESQSPAAGDVSGSFTAGFSVNDVQNNAVDLGAETVGDYMANLGTVVGLTITGTNSGEGSTPGLSVTYGFGANTAVQGSTQLTCASGSGDLSGGGTVITLGSGGTCGAITISEAPVFDTSVTTPLITYGGALTIQTTATGGADDLIFKTAGTEVMRLLENGNIYLEKGTNDVTIAVNAPGAAATYTFDGASGTILTTANYVTNLDATYVNESQSPAAGDVSGSFTAGFSVNDVQNNAVDLGAETVGDYMANLGTVVGLTITGTNSGEGSTPGLSVTYGFGANTAVQGSTQLTCASGSGDLSGGGTVITLGSGGTCGAITISEAPVFDTSVTTPLITYGGALTIQTTATGGADDLIFKTAGTEVMRLLENGNIYLEKGTNDVTIAVNAPGAAATYTFDGASGTILTTANYVTNLDATYVNESQSPAAGDVSGSFTAGFSVNDVQNNAVDLGAETVGDYMANLGTVVGLTITGTNSGEGSTPGLSVTYGFGANTAVQGSTQLTCASGSGDLSGGGTVITLGSGGTCGAITISEAPVFDTSVTTPLITYGGALTIQTTATGGADDLIFKTAGTEVMRLLENGNIYLEKGTNDVTIAVNAPGAAATYTFDGASGTILTTANYVTNLDATYVNESQSPAAGDVSGSFTAGFSVNDVQNNAVDLGAETVGDYMANLGTVVGLTITGTNSGEGSTPGLSVTYGFGANTAVQGSTQLTCASGSGDLSGGGTVITLGSGGTCGAITISEAPVFDTSVTTPLITYGGALTIQTTATGGADDLIFKTAGTEVMRLLENGNIYLEKGTNDVTIAVNAPGAAATYTFDGASGTILTTANYVTNLDATYVNESQSPAAGDVSGSFTAGFSVNDVQNNAVDLGAETVGDYMANLGTVVGLTITGTNSGEGSTPGLSVTYGFGANTAVQGSTQLTCASGSGDLSGGGTVITLGSGGTCGAITISEAPVFDTSVTTPLITYGGALTIQTTATGGADDLIFKTAGTEVMRLLENGNIYLEKGTNDVTIAVNAPGAAATYTFDGASGTILTTANYVTNLDATYVNESQSPAAGDVSGSFTAGFSVNDVQNNAVDLGAETVGDYMANLGTVVGLTITGTNSGEGSTPGLSVTYGFGANTAVQGSTQLTCASGSGDLSGGGTVITLGSGGTCGAITISEAPVFDTSVTTPLITYGGALTIQTTATGGADDLIFKTAGTEVMRLLENGNIYLEKGTNDVTIAVNAPGAAATYTFDGASGTILTTANYVTNLDATYVNESQSPAAGDVSGSFTAGFSVNDVQNNAVDLGAETVGDYMANLGTVVGLTITGTNSGEGSTPGLSVTYGFGANTAVQGSTQLTCASGSGDLSGGGTVITLGSGGTCGAITISEAPVFDTSVTTPLITYGGALTIQTTATGGADDLIFKTAGTEKIRILENGTLVFGTGANSANLYLSANDTLRTDDLFVAGAGLSVLANGATIAGDFSIDGLVFDPTGNLVLNDTVDIGSATTGLRVNTDGSIFDIDGVLVLNDQLNLGSSSTGLLITTSGIITDIDGASVVFGENITVNTGGITVTGNSTINGTLGSLTGLTVISGGASISGGLNNNSGGLTNAGSITGVGGNITGSGSMTISSGAAAALTLDSGTTGGLNIGTGNNAKTINIGTGTAGNAINIGTNNTTADTIQIGSALDTLTLTGSSLTTFVINAITVDATEFNRLDGKNAALVDENDFISGDGTGGTSNGSGLEAGTGGIGLLQGCTNNQILKWVDASSVWNCAADATGISDSRVKKNVQTVEGAMLDKIKDIRVVEFDYDCTSPAFAYQHCDIDHQTGVIAQELAQIFPELVTQDEHGYYSVRYDALAIYNLKAVGELARSLDSQGNGKFNNVSSNSLVVKGDIIAGTIRADRIEGLDYVGRFESLEERVDHLEKNNNFQNNNFAGTVEVGSLIANKEVDLKNDVRINGSTDLQRLNVNLALIAKDSFEVLGRSTFKEASGFEKDVHFDGQINVLGYTNVQGLSVNLDLIVKGSLQLDGPATFKEAVKFEKDAEFAGNVSVKGQATFNGDTAGYAIIKKGEKSLAIKFKNPKPQIPIVTMSLGNGKFASYSYQNVTKEGFEIILANAADEDLSFSWIAILTQSEEISAMP